MSEYSFNPYSFDTNILPTTDDNLRIGQVTKTALHPLKVIYEMRLNIAMSWLQKEGITQQGETELFSILQACDPTVGYIEQTARVPKEASEKAAEVIALVGSRLRNHVMGKEIVRISQLIWRDRAPVIWAALAVINNFNSGDILGPVPEIFSLGTWLQVVNVIKNLYTKMKDSYKSDISKNIQKKYQMINSTITRPLLETMLQVGLTSHDSGITNTMDIIEVWCMSSLVGTVYPHLEHAAQVLAQLDVETSGVNSPAYLQVIHNSTDKNILNMNAQLRRYLADMGISDNIPEVPKLAVEEIEKMTDIDRAHHYANDLFQVYKLIVRDTIMFQFRSARNKMPQEFQDKWSKTFKMNIDQTLPSIDNFLQDLLFMPLDNLVGDDFQTASEIRGIINIPRTFQDCILLSAFGKVSYIEFLREAAQDCGDHIQVRTETLLKYIARDAFRNLASFNKETIGTSSSYHAIIEVLDMVAKKINDMSSTILAVFALLQDTRNMFLEDSQINEGEVLSFIKIRNDNPDYGNRRFDISLDSHARAMMVKYESQPEILYDAFMSRKKAKSGGNHEIGDAINNLKVANKKYSIGSKQSVAAANELKRLQLKHASKSTVVLEKASVNAPAKVVLAPGKTPISNPTGMNKAGSTMHKNGSSVELIADETLPAPEGTGQSVVPRGPRNTYVFGPFTRIYRPEETPLTMAKVGQSEAATIQATVVERLLRGQNVCIFGYGQSGSGKTSLLIYFKTSETTGEMGIMSYICEHLTGKSSKYDRIQCDIREIGITKPGNTPEQVDVLDGSSNAFYSTKIFVPEHGTWVMQDKDYAKLQPLRKLSAEPTNMDVETEQQQIPLNYVPKDTLRPLGSYVFFSTENKRITKATTNNPTSSRSHIFVFLKFLRSSTAPVGTPEPTLIIGDFAGVENKFACNNSAVIHAFSTLKKYPDNPESDFAYKSEINRAFDQHVRGSLVSTRFAQVAYSQLESFDKKLTCPEKNNFSLFADKLQQSTAIQMAKNIPFVATTMGLTISEIVSMKRDAVGLPQRILLSTTTEQEQAFNKFISASVYRRNIYNAFMAGKPKLTGLHQTSEFCKLVLAMMSTVGVNVLDVMLFEIIKATARLFVGKECGYRVNEGVYINNSLEIFRNFLSKSLQMKGAVPKVLNECAAIQCNPFFNDCFGSTFTTSVQMGVVEETLVKMLVPTRLVNGKIIPVLGLNPEENYLVAQAALKNITFCVFNVINISKDRNDPPPMPFVDCSPVVYEFNRSASYSTRAETLTPLITGNPFVVVNGDAKFNIDVLKRLRVSVETIAKNALDTHNLDPTKISLAQAATAATDMQRDALQAIDEALAVVDSDILPKKVRQVIDTFERINSSTLIGTMIFTDTLAKFGVNRMMCVIDSPDTSEFIDNSIFGNIKKLQDSMNNIMCDKLLKGRTCI